MPWVVNHSKLSLSNITEENIEIVLDKSKEKVIEYCQYLCGYLERPNMNESYL